MILLYARITAPDGKSIPRATRLARLTRRKPHNTCAHGAPVLSRAYAVVCTMPRRLYMRFWRASPHSLSLL